MSVMSSLLFFFFFKQKTAYEMRISDWSSDVCSSDLFGFRFRIGPPVAVQAREDVPHGLLLCLVLQGLLGQDILRPGAGALSSVNGQGRDQASSSGPLARRISTKPTTAAAPMATAGLLRTKSRASVIRSEEHTSEHQSLMRNSYAVF